MTRSIKNRGRLVSDLWLGLVGLFILTPLIVILIVSFAPTSYGSFPPTGISLRWFANIGNVPDVRVGLINSLIVTCFATLGSVVLGLIISYGFSRRRGGLGNALMVGIQAPFMIPRVALGLAFFVLALKMGMYGGLTVLVLAHIVITLPITVGFFLVALANLPTQLEEAAWDLGCSRIQAIRMVLFPQLRPSIIGAGLLTAIISFDETEMTLFIADRTTITLPIAMFNYVQNNQDPTAAALSLVIIVAGILLGGIGLLIARAALPRKVG